MPRTKTTGSASSGLLDRRSPARKALRPSTEPTERSTLRVTITSV
jgi:hypothetical protein